MAFIKHGKNEATETGEKNQLKKQSFCLLDQVLKARIHLIYMAGTAYFKSMQIYFLLNLNQEYSEITESIK